MSGILELLSLRALWSLISPIVSDNISDRLKPKGSAETAKVRAFHLYSVLSEVEHEVDAFVEAFSLYCEGLSSLASQNISSVEYYSEINMDRVCSKLIDVITQLDTALNELNPQLRVHNPDLVAGISQFFYDDSRFIDRLSDEEDRLNAGAVNTANRMLAEAKTYRPRIHESAEQMRQFLAAQFSFTDSF